MVASLAHRGPDGSGEFLSDDCQLGAVRLAILDPKGGDQPLYGCQGRSVAVYNGEIYNHAELRRQLTVRHPIPDLCDATLIPHLYEELGDGLVAELRGMFAFAVWERARRRLLLVRDRVGIKPLYYASTPYYLLFASEIKGLIASGLLAAEVDRDALDDVFSLSYPSPPRTLFRGIVELRPGHVLDCEAGRPLGTPRRYWRAPFVPAGEWRKGRARDLAEELHSTLRSVTYEHLVADVRVATYLSGGLDSSALAALVKDVTGDPATTLSIGFASAEHDERAFAATMVDQLGGTNHTVVCDAQTADLYPSVIWHTELPLQFPLALPLSLLAARARSEGFPVVLTGEGADELFGGYDCFRGDRMRRMLDLPGLRSLRPQLYRQLYRWHRIPDGTVDLMIANHARAPRLAAEFGGVFPPWFDVWSTLSLDRERLLSPDGRRVRPVEEAPAGFHALVRDDVAELHPLDASLALEMETRLPSWILLIGDRASMAASVEARVPFLDSRVIDLVAPLPPHLKMRGLREKALLRDALRGRLPDSIRLRQKRPFYTPIRSWFFGEKAPAYVGDLLGEDALRRAGLFDPAVVTAMRREIRDVPEPLLRRVQLEWILILVLGMQILHQLFVQDFDPGRSFGASGLAPIGR
jgi:asparagine synthase (glutamine-hydrolysing)